MATYFALVEQVAMAFKTPKVSADTSVMRERYKLRIHTINNADPYQGITITEGHGKYPVIFEPLQNVQTSHSTYKVTSFIDFTPYLEYFQQFERYLEAFKASIKAFEGDPILQEFREQTMATTNDKTGDTCRHYPVCYVQSILYKLRIKQLQVLAQKREQEHCMACHMQACLVLKQFEYILNVTEYVNENYLRVKEKFLRAKDYVENINIGEPPSTDSTPRHKRDSESPFDTRVTPEETEYLIQLLTRSEPGFGESQEPTVLKTLFRKLSTKAK